MTTLSLAMIVRDAEQTLARALKSVVELCDELIVVDTGSLDNSAEIARRMGAKVHEFAWIDDFAAARNHSFQLCTSDWIMWLDADDLISEESRRRLLEVKSGSCSEAIDGIFMPYQQSFTSDGKCEMTSYRERWLRRQGGLRWDHPVHECIYVPPERALYVHDIFIEHRPCRESRATRQPERNLKILEKALSRGERNERNLFYYGNELRDHGRYEESVVIHKEYLAGGGRLSDRYWATRGVCRCYCALEELDQALVWALLAIEVDPLRAEGFNDVGIIHYRQNRISEAIHFFTAASKLQKPQGSFVEDCHYEWLPYDYLSSCYLSSGDYQKALECGLKALPDNPDKKRAENNIEFLKKLAAC